MENQLPKSDNRFRVFNKLLAVLLIFILLVVALEILIYFTDGQPQRIQTANNAITPASQDKPTIYSEITGKIVRFDLETSVLTIEKDAKAFTVVLPIGKNNTHPLPGFLKISPFQVGNRVTIGGYGDNEKEFQITRFQLIP